MENFFEKNILLEINVRVDGSTPTNHPEKALISCYYPQINANSIIINSFIINDMRYIAHFQPPVIYILNCSLKGKPMSLGTQRLYVKSFFKHAYVSIQ